MSLSFYDIKTHRIDGSEVALKQYKDKTVVVVNTASKCGYTPQYEGLEALYQQGGIVVLGFPSNDFGGQEPGSNKEIASFCKLNYGVTFPLFEKSVVTGPNKNPVFKNLIEASSDHSEIKWNFEKFILSPSGKVVARFRSGVKPDSDEFQKALAKAREG